MSSAWHGVQLVWFDADVWKCATSPPFLGSQACAATDVLLTSIKERLATIDPTGLLECAVLLENGCLLQLPSRECARYGVDQLRQYMGSQRDELDAAHAHRDRT